jgi:hypothetical protein
MVSEKQLLANRENALKGGVKTAAGKAVSSRNATSHGIFSHDVLLSGENSSLLFELQQKLLAELQPVGEIETVLVDRIVSSTWRLKRVLRSEKKYARPASRADGGAGAIPGVDYRYQSWQNVIRYETTLERQIYKAIHELERLQHARKDNSSSVALETSQTEPL